MQDVGLIEAGGLSADAIGDGVVESAVGELGNRYVERMERVARPLATWEEEGE